MFLDNSLLFQDKKVKIKIYSLFRYEQMPALMPGILVVYAELFNMNELFMT